MADMTGGKIIWASDENGEVGKRPKDDPKTFWVSAEALDALRLHTAYHSRNVAHWRGKRFVIHAKRRTR